MERRTTDMNVDLATGEVRLSYVALVHPTSTKNTDAESYRVTALIPKTDTQTVEAIRKACRDVYDAACASDGVFAGRRPQIDVTKLLHDGDGLKQNGTPYGPECKGHWVVYLSSPAVTRKGVVRPRPGIVTADNPTHPLTDDEAEFIKSGDYGRVAMQVYAYSSRGADGVTASLLYTMWTRAGESLAVQHTPDVAALFGVAQPETAVFNQAPQPAAAGTPPAQATAPVGLTPEMTAALPPETRAQLGL